MENGKECAEVPADVINRVFTPVIDTIYESNGFVLLLQELLGENHSDTAESYNDIGSVHSKLGEYTSALVFFEEVLSTMREILGVKHPMVAMSLGSVASVHVSRENYSDAELLLNESLNSLIDTCGERHPYTINILKQMAELHEKTGNAVKAQRIQEKLKTFSRG